MPGKSHKYGLKLYKICTPESYTWNFQVHAGKTNNVDGLNTTESLTVSLTKSAVNLGSTISLDQGNKSNHVLSEGNKENNGRKRCRGCYDKISKNENAKLASNKARRVSSYCVQCESKPHLCISCFAEKHEFQ